MPNSNPTLEPSVSLPESRVGRWMVVIFNNPHNTVDEVIDILIRATGCSFDEASIETWEAHNLGSAAVHFAAQAECERVAGMISKIGVQTEVRPEWDD